jgi:hypothetical protein
MTDGTITVKNMTTGEQNSMVAETLSELLIK